MLFNQVYQYTNSSERVRVVYEAIEFIWLIDIDDGAAWPVCKTTSELQELIDSQSIKSISEPFTFSHVESESVQGLKRDEAYSLLKILLKDHYELLDKGSRNRLIRSAVEETGKPRIYFIRQLRRYWQRGMTPNSLLPDYHKSGGKGKPRRDVGNKLGRKRTRAEGVGAIITDDVAEIFSLAIDGFFLPNGKLSLKDAKGKAIGLYKSRYPDADKTSIPTPRQFRYFYESNYRKNDVVRRRTPSKIYDKDIRPLTSTSAFMNIGPGGRYEIDATIADLYLVSENDPNKIIGRPVVYIVKDVFSRMVTGLYVGLENPSWVAAMMAMSNAFLDKTEYCRSYGIEIDSSMWPSVGMPASIMADKGELLHRQADVLVNAFNIQLSNSRSYRGDDKGGVERYFNTLQTTFKPYIGGIVEPVNGKKRLGRRYELDAELTLSAFTETVIHIILHYNTRHVVKDYDFAEDMPDDLPAVPLQLWNWGIKNRTGKLRPCSKDMVEVNLLPTEKATVSEVGIGFKGLKYTCREAIAAGWFDRFKHVRPAKVDIAFDPRRTDVVYLRPDNDYQSYWVCELSDRSRRFKGMSFVEAAGIFKSAKIAEASAKQEMDFTKPDLQMKIENLAEQARKRKANAPKLKNSQKLAGIKTNRDNERELERDRVTTNSEYNVVPPKADVVDIKTGRGSASIDYPSLDEFLGDDDD
ncbi:Mu transposase C-terminal domain-containing protein [Shewanella sp. Isolate13]|uniref:Mu transposase C-terminal domain-containing protein n=1 Tax=Shewanella sp. Isolate13 TaxID=2908531 RepID=UPI001EFE3DAC|nr:Mu transposase C-terminal domain-containing protein [Shewanella sp. Isolate13]MCG9731112.1 Mu transposase C-terminal domain-containing protein [Shewanella sp. Isolate13]